MVVVACPVLSSETLASGVVPSSMVTAPVAGCPASSVTLMCAEACVYPPWSWVWTASVVCVVAACALAAPAVRTAASSAKPSPATLFSRGLRRIIPITCACSKF